MAHLDADLAVTLDEDRPGMLAKALGCVSGAGINIDGYAEIGGVVHVLSPDLQAAHDCLQKGGFRILQEQQVLLVTVADEPGSRPSPPGSLQTTSPDDSAHVQPLVALAFWNVTELGRLSVSVIGPIALASPLFWTSTV